MLNQLKPEHIFEISKLSNETGPTAKPSSQESLDATLIKINDSKRASENKNLFDLLKNEITQNIKSSP